MKVDYVQALEVARQQLGLSVREVESNWGGQITRYLAAVDIYGPAAWCAAFCAYCLEMAGGCPWLAEVRNDGYVPEIRDWAIKHGLYQPKVSAQPKGGDLVIFGDADHLAMLEFFNPRIRAIQTIEGNTKDDNPAPQDRGRQGLFRKHHSLLDRWPQGFIVWPLLPRIDVTVLMDGLPVAVGEIRDGRAWGPLAPVLSAAGISYLWRQETRELVISRK